MLSWDASICRLVASSAEILNSGQAPYVIYDVSRGDVHIGKRYAANVLQSGCSMLFMRYPITFDKTILPNAD